VPGAIIDASPHAVHVGRQKPQLSWETGVIIAAEAERNSAYSLHEIAIIPVAERLKSFTSIAPAVAPRVAVPGSQ
jgi:hypothetical protein